MKERSPVRNGQDKFFIASKAPDDFAPTITPTLRALSRAGVLTARGTTFSALSWNRRRLDQNRRLFRWRIEVDYDPLAG
jgi:hypothetical protein